MTVVKLKMHLALLATNSLSADSRLSAEAALVLLFYQTAGRIVVVKEEWDHLWYTVYLIE
jgi:hypothetical protein